MKKLAALTALFCLGVSPAFAATKKAEDKSPAAKPPGVAKYDTKLPVEISSDNLEVLQKENKAIFRGNVIAVQGKLRLNSDVMIVHYKQKDDKTAAGAATPAQAKPAPAKPAGAAAPSGDMGAISLIEVEGHVLMASPEETAEGDKGNYDVDKRFLHLTGEHVVLTRGQNILRGKQVDYDLDTGRSVLTTGDEKQKGNGDTRVRGVFIPKSGDKPAAKPDARPDTPKDSK